jgi:hypothetical protein
MSRRNRRHHGVLGVVTSVGVVTEAFAAINAVRVVDSSLVPSRFLYAERIELLLQ